MHDPLEIYLRLIFPWETEYQQLWKSVTWKWIQTDPKKGPPVANYAAMDYDNLVKLIQTRTAKAQTDVYVALGTQRIAITEKPTKDGLAVKANRTLPNIVSLKAVWLDIDVGKPPKADGTPSSYATQIEAAVALQGFLNWSGLPTPTMIVLSGSGGMHVYWCTQVQMGKEEWHILATGLQQAAIAYGLLFDPQVTVNGAGILRPPGTRNWKDPMNPKPVELVQPANGNYPVYQYMNLVNTLGHYCQSVTAIKPLVPFNPNNVTALKTTHNFTAGVAEVPPVPLDDIIAVCPATAEIEARGGNGDLEPLWSTMMLLASFTDDTSDSAHRLSRGDPRYTVAETDRKLAEKFDARAKNPTLGWPKCQSIALHHPACKTCPLLSADKSPLSFVHKPAAMSPGAINTTSDALIPLPYWRNQDGHVFITKRTSNGEDIAIDILEKPIYEAGISELDGTLVFKTHIMGSDMWASIPAGSLSQTSTMLRAFGNVGRGGFCLPESKHKTAREFMAAWITHLQTTKQTKKPDTYGWTVDGTGFTYDGVTYRAGGKDVAYLGKAFYHEYKQTGDMKPWQDAMLALCYGRPFIETVAATAFAAPLTEMIGSTSAFFSVYSAESGAGKSTALKLAQAVWGHPKKGMSQSDDTNLSVRQKVADLKSLPIYWDELGSQQQLETVARLMFNFTQGKGKARLNQNATQQEAPTYATLMCAASNHGLANAIYDGSQGTEAGGLRVFEIEAPAMLPTKLTMFQSQQLLLALETNYGHAGTVYAEYIVNNKKDILNYLDQISRKLDADYKFQTKERFWAITMTVIMTGAIVANNAGITHFDLPSIYTLLGQELTRQRSMMAVQTYTTMASADAANSLMSELMAELRGKSLLVTDMINHGRGQPSSLMLVEGDTTRLENVWMQYGAHDHRIRMGVKAFHQWLKKRNLNPQHVLALLRQDYDIYQNRLSLGSGLDAFGVLGQQRFECYDLTPKPVPTSSFGSSLD